MTDDLRNLLEICSKYGLSVRIWGNGEEVSVYFDCGTFEHPKEAIEYINDNLQVLGDDEPPPVVD